VVPNPEQNLGMGGGGEAGALRPGSWEGNRDGTVLGYCPAGAPSKKRRAPSK